MAAFDSESLQALVNAHGAALRLFASQWCNAPDDAVQEALISLVQQPAKPENVVAWLFVAVRRRAANLARAERRRAKHQHAASQDRQDWFEDDREAGLEAERLLHLLPQLDREIVVARIWGELSFAEISNLISHPLSTVHRRYQQALEQMSIAAEADAASRRSPAQVARQIPSTRSEND